ncbi:putative DNA primase/helicase [Sphingomonas gellani]|uniref:Putative DNA primase/helicase n=2 Tax=Sphingomonas gellani TaxID=1166340 RepID=A0A1H8BZU9_9SPHN|nr:putative DNA primase/helicase [Sphingomonas gellani]
MLDAALHFASRGWPVFPCKPTDKSPYLPRDKDADGKPIPRSGGVSKANTDPDQIRAWWKKWPKAMIGIAAGRSGLLIVDFDPRVDEHTDEETGEVTTEVWTLDRLKAELEAAMGCPLPVSLAVRTPSGGVHVYFRMPDGVPIGNVGSLPDHIDVRGEGGYVIVPPSYCVGDGKRCVEGPYRWLRGDADAPIVDMPDALVTILRTPKTKPARADAARPAVSMPSDVFPVDVDAAHRRYAMAALDRTVMELASTPVGGGRHGGRNKGAYQAAYNMGGFVGAGAISIAVVRSALIEVVRTFDPAAFDKHLAAIDNGLEGGQSAPHDLSGIGTYARRRDSGGSASSSGAPPLPPVDAYADELDRYADRPAPGFGSEADAFQSGTSAVSGSTTGSGGRIAPSADPDTDRACATMAMTDLGNAERFHRRHGWRFRFCTELGWFVWDDRRWELLSEEKDKMPGKVSLAVFDTIRAIRHEADLVEASGLREDLPEDAPDDVRRSTLNFIYKWRGAGDSKVPIYFSDMLRDHAKSSEGAQRLGCIAGLVKSFPDIAIRADAMDADRLAINVLNGTIRLGLNGNMPSIRLDPHRPGDLISKVANVIYDPDATCETYDGFLATVQPDEKMRRFLHQWAGLSMTGDISEQKLAFWHGKGRNGKSTLSDLLGHIAGDYGGSVAIETFLDQGRGRKGGEATPDLARLPGIRFLRTSEPEKGAKLAEALIKLITGGEPIDARHLNKGFFTFLPSFKVTVSGNHKPKITGHDDGIWRRVMLVPWDVQIAKEEVDKSLPDKLRKEASGVFNRMLAGLLDWRMEGLVEPESVIAATAKYREQSDQLGRFLDECTRPKEGARAKSSELFALFTAWAKANGAAEWQQVGFTKAMEDRGFENKRSNGIQWLDMEMTKSVSDFAETEPSSGGYGHDPGPFTDYDTL